jgi:undecaprenyl diphosphate synthase
MFKQFFRFWRDKKRDRINDTIADNLIKEIDPAKLPRHIAIIMDGNGRWALRHGMPRSYGHRAGVESLKDIVRICSDLKVKILTVYAFSTENWKRPPEEVSILMDLLVEYFEREIDELHRNKVKVCPIGKMQNLPPAVMRSLRMAEERTRDNDGLILNVAFNYGSATSFISMAV